MGFDSPRLRPRDTEEGNQIMSQSSHVIEFENPDYIKAFDTSYISTGVDFLRATEARLKEELAFARAVHAHASAQTPKRQKATKRLVDAYQALVDTLDEVEEGLADCENAV